MERVITLVTLILKFRTLVSVHVLDVEPLLRHKGRLLGLVKPHIFVCIIYM